MFLLTIPVSVYLLVRRELGVSYTNHLFSRTFCVFAMQLPVTFTQSLARLWELWHLLLKANQYFKNAPSASTKIMLLVSGADNWILSFENKGRHPAMSGSRQSMLSLLNFFLRKNKQICSFQNVYKWVNLSRKEGLLPEV